MDLALCGFTQGYFSISEVTNEFSLNAFYIHDSQAVNPIMMCLILRRKYLNMVGLLLSLVELNW